MVQASGPSLTVSCTERPCAPDAEPGGGDDHADDKRKSDEICEEGEMSCCPICFSELSGNLVEIGALTHHGRRIEKPLYHAGCVSQMLFHKGSVRTDAGSATGGLRITWGLSPMTRQPVDGFLLMPPFDDVERWRVFLDWQGKGEVTVEDLAATVAAILPVPENGAEQIVRDNFNVQGNGSVALDEVEATVLPYLRKQVANLNENRCKDKPEKTWNEGIAERYSEILCTFLEDTAQRNCRKPREIISAIRTLQGVASEGDNRACSAAAQLLTDQADEVRQAAMTLLYSVARKGDEQVLAEVAKGLQHDSNSVRKTVVEAVGRLADKGCQPAVKMLCDRLLDDAVNVRLAALQALPGMALRGDRFVIDVLLRQCKSKEPSVREKTMSTLAQIAEVGDMHVTNAIVGLLQDGDFTVRRSATAALGQVVHRGDKHALKLIHGMMNDSDADVRWGGVCALAHAAEIGDRQALAALMLQAKEKEPWLRSAVMKTMGQLVPRGDTRSIKFVENIVANDHDPGVRDAAKRALERIAKNQGSASKAPSNRQASSSGYLLCCRRRTVQASSTRSFQNMQERV